MKTFCVVKELPFAKAGSEMEWDESDPVIKQYVSEGKILEKSKKGMSEVETELAATADPIASIVLAKVMASLEKKAKAMGAPLNFSVSENDPTQVKDKLSLGELLQAAGWAASPNFGDRCQKGIHLLQNKYKVLGQPGELTIGKAFESRWDESSKMQEDGETVGKAATQIESAGALGGFLLRPQFSATIFELIDLESVLVSSVAKRVVTTLDYYEPTKDYSLGGAGASPYLAGMTGAWLAESQSFPQTNMLLRQIHLKMNLFGAYTVVTRQMLFDNAYAFEQMMTSNFAKTAAFYLGLAIFKGTGAAQPKGFTNATAAIARNRTAAANGALLSDLATMVGATMPDEGARSRYFWMISPSARTALILLNDSSGRLVYVPNFPSNELGQVGPRVPMQLFGMPVVVSQFPASSGTSTDFVLVDPTAYILGMRQDLEVAASEHVNFLSNAHTYRFLMRADGTSALNTFLTLQNGDTVSPFYT